MQREKQQDRLWTMLLWGAGLLVLLGGCDEAVDPALSTDKSYTLFGVLTPSRDTQSVRVYPIEDRLMPTKDEPLNVQFSSTDHVSGETHVWKDSLVVEPDSERVHVFWAPFKAAYGHTYRITAVGEDAQKAQATVEIPEQVEVVQQPAQVIVEEVTLPILIKGDAPHVTNVQAEYSLQYDKPSEDQPLSQVTTHITLPYEENKWGSDEGRVISIALNDAYKELWRAVRDVQRNRSFGIRLLGVTLRFVVANKEWDPPGGAFDPDVLVQPGTMTNVEGGFGFVGGGYHKEKVLNVPDSIATEAGFRSIRQ